MATAAAVLLEVAERCHRAHDAEHRQELQRLVGGAPQGSAAHWTVEPHYHPPGADLQRFIASANSVLHSNLPRYHGTYSSTTYHLVAMHGTSLWCVVSFAWWMKEPFYVLNRAFAISGVRPVTT
jgi:hypothetical protein